MAKLSRRLLLGGYSPILFSLKRYGSYAYRFTLVFARIRTGQLRRAERSAGGHERRHHAG